MATRLLPSIAQQQAIYLTRGFIDVFYCLNITKPLVAVFKFNRIRETIPGTGPQGEMELGNKFQEQAICKIYKGYEKYLVQLSEKLQIYQE